MIFVFLFEKKQDIFSKLQFSESKIGGFNKMPPNAIVFYVNSTNIIIRVTQCNERWSATDRNLNSIWPEKPSRPATGQDRHNCIKKTEESGKTCKVHSQHLYVVDHRRGNSFKTKPEKVQ